MSVPQRIGAPEEVGPFSSFRTPIREPSRILQKRIKIEKWRVQRYHTAIVKAVKSRYFYNYEHPSNLWVNPGGSLDDLHSLVLTRLWVQSGCLIAALTGIQVLSRIFSSWERAGSLLKTWDGHPHAAWCFWLWLKLKDGAGISLCCIRLGVSDLPLWHGCWHGPRL